MKQNKKYLGIGQPLHYDTLREIFLNYFNNKKLTREEVIELLKIYINGENSINKAYAHINNIFQKNENLLKIITDHIDGKTYSNLLLHDNQCLILCLVGLTYPVAYNIANTLAIGFKVQSKLNRDYIDKKLTAFYGSNRSIYNAINSILPMFQELDIISKDKGLFKLEEQRYIHNKFLNELYIYTDIKLSGSKSMLVDDLDYRPWYLFFKPQNKIKTASGLVKVIESRIGEGYLTI